MLCPVDLGLSEVSGENGQDEKEDNTDIEGEENILNWDVFLVVTKLLQVANTQDNVELFSLFCFK